MNKPLVSSSADFLRSVEADISAPAAPIDPFFRRYFKNLALCTPLRKNASAEAKVELQTADEKDRIGDSYRSALYDLAANNPYVIAASIFSTTKRR